MTLLKIIVIAGAEHCTDKMSADLLYRIGLHSNIATPLALFVRIELLCFCSCIHRQTSFVTNTATAAQIMP